MEFDTRRRRAVLTVSIEGAQQQSWSRHPQWLAMKRQAARLHGQRHLMHRCGVVPQYASKAEKTGPTGAENTKSTAKRDWTVPLMNPQCSERVAREQEEACNFSSVMEFKLAVGAAAVNLNGFFRNAEFCCDLDRKSVV